MTNAITIPTEIAAAYGFDTEITLAELAVILGVDAPATTEPETAPVDEEQEAADRKARMRSFREAARATSAAAIAAVNLLAVGQIVKTTDGYFILEGRSERVTWTECGDGSVAQTKPIVTVSKCRSNGVRMKSRQYETVAASEFGRTLEQ